MTEEEQHLENLVRHLSLVREASLRIARKLLAQPDPNLTLVREIARRGHAHDLSKFTGLEWMHLHRPTLEPVGHTGLWTAVWQHQHTNDHHPEFWVDLEHQEREPEDQDPKLSLMPPAAIIEMVCDWYARSQEFGTDLRQWIRETAFDRYDIEEASRVAGIIWHYVDLLLEPAFTPRTEESA